MRFLLTLRVIASRLRPGRKAIAKGVYVVAITTAMMGWVWLLTSVGIDLVDRIL